MADHDRSNLRPARHSGPGRRTGLGRREFIRQAALVASAGLATIACGPSRATTTATAAPAPTSAPPVVGTSGQAAQPTNAANPTAPPAAAGGAAAAAGTPVRGGVLTWAQWDLNDSIEPANASGASALEIIGAVTDSIVAIDSNQKIYPALATNWTIDDDSKRYTFTLRDDVKFHDGTPLDSTAVKRSWDRILDPAMKAAGTVALMGPIDQIMAPDPRTVVVTLKDSFPLLLLQLWRQY